MVGGEIGSRFDSHVKGLPVVVRTVGGLRKLRHRRGPLVQWIFTFTAAAHDIVRMRRLLLAYA